MASKNNHSSRSKRSHLNKPYGMYTMDQNSNLKTMQRRRLKDATQQRMVNDTREGR